MSFLKTLSAIRLTVTGARGPVGIKLIGTVTDGQVLVKLPSGPRDFAGGSALPAGSVLNALGSSTSIAPSQAAVAGGLAQKASLATANAFVGAFSLTALGTAVPTSGSYIGVGGNSLSFATLVSAPSGGADNDNQRASALFVATTSDDGNSEEQTVCILTTIQTGYSKPWAVSTNFSAGDNVRTNGNVYRCTTAGKSASSGTGPSGKSSSITDGAAVWRWINDDATDAKVGLYNEVLVLPGAGSSWAQAHNIQIQPGVASPFIVNSELDMTNNCGTDSVLGGLNKYNIYAVNNGSNKSTSVLEIGSSNTATYSSIWGIHLTGSALASNSVIGIDASSAVGIGFGSGAGGAVSPTFTDSVIKDGSSTAPKGLSLAGNYSSSAMEVGGTSPAGLAFTDAFRTGSGYMIYSGPFRVDKSGNAYINQAGFNGNTPIAKPTVSGAKGGNAALASLTAALAAYGLITDSTT